MEVIENKDARIIWRGEEVGKKIRSKLELRFMRVGEYVVNEIKVLLSTGGPEPSKPGEAPHGQTGRLRNSIFWRLGSGSFGAPFVQIGTNLRYGLFLELGTVRMDPRPWLRSTIHARMSTIRSMLRGAA